MGTHYNSRMARATAWPARQCAVALAILPLAAAGLTCGRAVPAGTPAAGPGIESDAPPPGYEALERERVPRTLHDAIETLVRSLPRDTLQQLRAAESDVTLELQDTLGRWMRDRWGLWAGSPLAESLRELGLDHPDDMSGVILTSFWRRLHFQPLRVEAQVQWYRAYRHAIAPPGAERHPSCPGGVEVTTWWTPRLDAPAAVSREAEGALRIVHLGQCCADGTLWAWEAGRGWFAPEPAHRRHWARLPPDRRGCG